jgi:hypothetical protein
LALGTAAAASANVNYPDFTSSAGLALNGSAALSTKVLRLTEGNDQSGSAFTDAAALDPARSFSTEFVASIHDGNNPPADGMALVIQRDPRGAAALGATGGYLGYGDGAGPSAITPSLEIELDTFDNSGDGFQEVDGNHVAIHVNGDPSMPVIPGVSPGFTLYGTAETHVWVDYKAGAHKLDVYVDDVATKPAAPVLSHTINLESLLGGPARAGFTAGTASLDEIHDVLSWSLKETLRTSSASVVCAPSPVDPGGASTCTATVADVDVGDKVAPTGTVTFGGEAAGTCVLAPGESPGVATCSISFTSSTPGARQVTTAWPGDATHRASAGETSVGVRHPTTTRLTCPDDPIAINKPVLCGVRVSSASGGPPTGIVSPRFDGAGVMARPGGAACALQPVAVDTSTCALELVVVQGPGGERLAVNADYLGSDAHVAGSGADTVERLTVPTRGVDFNASALKGTVLVSVPKKLATGRMLRSSIARGAAAIRPPAGFTPFRELGKDDNIPVGSILDASRGLSSITMASSPAGATTQTGQFSKGVFKTKQAVASPLTTATMLGGGNLKRDCRKVRRSRASAAVRRPGRQLFANVRGTQYLVKDSCAGTLTMVQKGSVVVRDLRLRKNKVVKAGHRYLARAARKPGHSRSRG